RSLAYRDPCIFPDVGVTRQCTLRSSARVQSSSLGMAAKISKFSSPCSSSLATAPALRFRQRAATSLVPPELTGYPGTWYVSGVEQISTACGSEHGTSEYSNLPSCGTGSVSRQCPALARWAEMVLCSSTFTLTAD